MAIKIPFIESYLEDFKNDNDVNNIINNNCCKIIPYTKIDNVTNIDDYDYIIITKNDDLYSLIIKDSVLFNDLRNKEKLFFIDDYHDNLHNDLYNNLNIKVGLYVNILNKYKKFFMPNLLINVSFVRENSQNVIKSKKIIKYLFNYLSSSVKQINICDLIELKKNYLNNFTNNVKIINFDNYIIFGKIKYPKNIIICINDEHLYDKRILSKRLKNILDIKTKKTLYKLTTSKGTINFHDYNNSEKFQQPYDNIIIKDNKKIYLHQQHYEKYESEIMHRNLSSNIDKNYFKEIAKKEENYKYIWNTFCLRIYNKNLKKTKRYENILVKKTKHKIKFIYEMIEIKKNMLINQ